MAAREFRLFSHALLPEQAAQLRRAIDFFHAGQDQLRIVIAGARALPLRDGLADFEDLQRAPRPEVPELTVTGAELVDGWFTHVDTDRALLSIGHWEQAFGNDRFVPAAAPDAYILESLALTAFLLCCGGEDYHYLHPDTRACLLDRCADKADRAIKMRAGYLCTVCQDRAAAAGVSPLELDAIQLVIERVRQLTLGRRPQPPVAPSELRVTDDQLIAEAVLPPEVALPGPLISAARDHGLTVVVGSGMSMQADVAVAYREGLGWNALPRWPEIGARLAELTARYRAREQAPRACTTLDEYLTDLDFFKAALGERAYYPRAIFDVFAPRVRDPGRANRLVFRLPLKWVLTTNYDLVLSFAAPAGTAVYTWREARQAREYLALARSHPPLLKIHGCASRPDTIVLTSSEYQVMRQADEYVALMRFVFDAQATLFLGYGFSDPMDLDLALRQAQLAGAAQGEKFALIPASQAAAVRERFPNVHVIAYAHHEDLARILAVLVRETTGA